MSLENDGARNPQSDKTPDLQFPPAAGRPKRATNRIRIAYYEALIALAQERADRATNLADRRRGLRQIFRLQDRAARELERPR